MYIYIYIFFFFSPFSDPVPIVESSIEESVLGDVTLEDRSNEHVTFRVVEEGSKRRKTKLVDSLGYSYNIRSKRSYVTYWQCVVRPRGNACKATVIQRDRNFRSGENFHNHPAEAGAMTAAKIVNLVKEKALENKFKPASAIVEEVFNHTVQISERSVDYWLFIIFHFLFNSVIHYSASTPYNIGANFVQTLLTFFYYLSIGQFCGSYFTSACFHYRAMINLNLKNIIHILTFFSGIVKWAERLTVSSTP